MARIHTGTCPVCKGHSFTDFLVCTDFFVSGEKFKITACTGCNFKITQDVPDEASADAYYQSEEYISHSDTSKGLINKAYHVARNYMLTQKRKTVIRHTRKKTGTLLDLGAGTGYFAAHMKNYGWKVTGTEKSSEARTFASKEQDIDLIPAEDLFTLESHHFDAVTLWHVLEHFYHPEKYIREIKRVLAPEGILVIALPNHSSYDAKHYKQYWAAWDVPRHLWHFTPAHVKQLFEKYGFTLVAKHTMLFDAFYVSLLSEKYKKSHLAFMKGLIHGKISWLVSLLNKDRCSSVIYVLRNNNQSSR
jgi:2-polyprenyl-3-methyl-5-hydroxy-6-metoxy-1,4-benzoquinol methylase